MSSEDTSKDEHSPRDERRSSRSRRSSSGESSSDSNSRRSGERSITSDRSSSRSRRSSSSGSSGSERRSKRSSSGRSRGERNESKRVRNNESSHESRSDSEEPKKASRRSKNRESKSSSRSSSRSGRSSKSRSKGTEKSEGLISTSRIIQSLLGREIDSRDEETDTRALRGIFEEIKPYTWGMLVFLAVLLTGAGTSVFSQGVLLLGVGASLFVMPPTQRVSGAFALLSTLLCLLGLHTWLPMGESMLSAWRLDLLYLKGVEAFPILGPNIGDHLVSWLLLVACLLWVRMYLTWRLSTEGAHAVLWLIALMLAGLGGFVMLANKLDLRLPFATDPSTFSYFPNRNHSSILLAVGACLSGGMAIYQAVQLRLIGVGVAAFFTLLCLSGMLPMQSRGGVFFFVFGMIGFVTVTSLFKARKGSGYWLELGVPAVVMFISLFVLLDARVRDRIVSLVRGDFSAISDEFRFAVWADVWTLIRDNPFGVGLGQFAANMPQYMQQSTGGKAVLHPESSWFWLVAELGWLGLGLLVAALLFLTGKTFLSLKRVSNPIRFLALTGVGVLSAHSLVDVGLHRPVMWLFASILLGVVYSSDAKLKLQPIAPLRRGLVRFGGGALMLIGLLWVLGSLFKFPVHPDSIAAKAEEEISRAATVRQPQAVLDASELWLKVEPLSWSAHYARANGYLRAGGTNESLAADAFRSARFLEPNQGLLGLREGETWLAAGNVARAFNAWNWMLERRSENDCELRNQLFQRTWDDEYARRQLIALSETRPGLRLMVYERAELKAFMDMLTSDLEADGFGLPFWDQVPTELQHRWVNMLGKTDFENFVKRNPHLAVLLTFWPLRYEGLVGERKYQEAINFFGLNAAEPGIPGDVDGIELVSLERQYSNTRHDLFRGFLLVKKYLELEDEASALELLQEIRTSKGAVPDFAHYWEGELLRRSGDLEGTCAAWSRWLLVRFGERKS